MEERERLKQEQLGIGLAASGALSWLCEMNGLMASLPSFSVSQEEKGILRKLASRVAGLADLPIQQERKQLWKDHLSLKQTRPLVFIDPELAWYEIMPHTCLKCTSPLARIWEYRLRKEIYWQEEIGDDRVCRKEFSVQSVVHFTDMGIKTRHTGGENYGAYHIDPAIKDYDEDLPKLHFTDLYYDKEASEKLLTVAHDVFDGILPVVTDNSWWFSLGLTSEFIFLRGYENFLYDLYDYPDEVKALMGFLRDNALHKLSLLEDNRLLSCNNGGEFMGTGGYGWCDELPAPGFDPDHVRPMDMWGYCESQESGVISPEAFAEFVLPFQLPILEKFGLNVYGCCEPLDNWIDILKEKIPRLRKVTVSPWADTRIMADKLGKDYVYCWKMSAAEIAVPHIDREAIREKIHDTFAYTGKLGCPVEVLNRDIRTLAYSADNAKEWVRIAMDEAKRV